MYLIDQACGIDGTQETGWQMDKWVVAEFNSKFSNVKNVSR